MTSEKKCRIADCQIAVIGTIKSIDCIKAELKQPGFKHIHIISPSDEMTMPGKVDIIVENVNEGNSCLSKDATIPLILSFDFVNGAGAIVVMPYDEKDMLRKLNSGNGRQHIWQVTVHFGMWKVATGYVIRCQTLETA